MTNQFSYFQDLGERLISIQENQSEKILQRRFLLNDDSLQKGLSVSDAQYAQKQQALLEMEINIHELFAATSGYIVKSDASLKGRINDTISDFQYWFERFLDLNGYNNGSNSNGSGSIQEAAAAAPNGAAGETHTDAAPLSVQQRQLPHIQNGGLSLQQYEVIIKQDFDRVSALTRNIIAIEDEEQNQLVEFTRAETGIRDLLDNKIKSIVLEKIQALEDSANGMVTTALISIIIAITLAVILGIIISGYIVKPIKRLRREI